MHVGDSVFLLIEGVYERDGPFLRGRRIFGGITEIPDTLYNHRIAEGLHLEFVDPERIVLRFTPLHKAESYMMFAHGCKPLYQPLFFR